jgi:hypothetical protein
MPGSSDWGAPPISKVTVPPVFAVPLVVPVPDEAPEAGAEDELDELEPQAPSTTAAMTESTIAAIGLVFRFTDPPPQRSNSQREDNLLQVVTKTSHFGGP